MNSSSLFIVVMVLVLSSYWFGMRRSINVAGGVSKIKTLNSLPSQFGLLSAFWCGIPAMLLLLLWSMFEPMIIESIVVNQLPQQIQSLNDSQIGLYMNDVHILAQSNQLSSATVEKRHAAQILQQVTTNSIWLKTAAVLIIALASVIILVSKFTPVFKARKYSESIIKGILMASSGVAILTTLGIVMSVLFESIQFFSEVPATDFLFGTQWSPQIAMRTDQVGSSGAFGAVPLFAGTLLITAIAMTIAVPIGLMTAIYLSNYATPRQRTLAKPMLELLAGVPTVVYGFFAALTVAPFIRNAGESIGLSVASESALAAGLVMGIMIIPFVSSLSDDAISAVPKALKEGSLGMGATLSETIKLVLLPAALPGIVGAILLAVSRAIGETMIVVMAAGMAANLTANPLESVTTVTVQIVTLLTGDQEFDSPKTLAAFALGLMLFVTTLALNVIALKVVRKYREQYD
ncbi:MAG: phosphate transport system permease protein [Alteromonadaceae bacterium]|jgi:phosphate transport system permease protein